MTHATRILALLTTLLAMACDDGVADLGDAAAQDDCASIDSNQPGSACVLPIRFDFEPDEADLDQRLQDQGIDFATPEQGFQITTEGIKLDVGDDDEYCEAFEVPPHPDGPDGEYCITRAEVAMSPGYHHLFVAKAPVGSPSEELMTVGERVRCVGGAHVTYGTDLLPIPLPQSDYVDVPYWEGVGLKLKGGQKVSVNYHYLNVTDEPIIGVTKLNFHASDCEGLKEMGQFGFYNQDIAVAPGEFGASEMVGTFSQDVYVLDMFRHTHRFGVEVPISFYGGERDGEVFFNSPDYEQGAAYQFPEPVLMKKGEGFKFVCQWENPTDRWLRFGPTADDEMCMLLGTWWVADGAEEPKVQHRYKWPE